MIRALGVAPSGPPALRLLIGAATLLPPVLAVVFIVGYAQPVPFWDEWVEPANIAISTAEGTLTFDDLTRQYNDSRPFFSNTLTALSTLTLDWNLKAEMLFNQGLALVTLSLIILLLRRRTGTDAAVVSALMSLIVFSLTQRVNMLWAIQGQYYFVILFVVAAIAVVDRSETSWRSLSAAAFLAACATFSYANGLLAWPCLLPVLWCLGYRSRGHLLFWLLAATACLSLYFRGFVFNSPAVSELPDPLSIGGFVLAFLGNALISRHGPPAGAWTAAASIAGGIGLVLLVANTILVGSTDRGRRRAVPWLGLALFVLASAALAATARIPAAGVDGAMANRYITLSLSFWIAFVGSGTEVLALTRSTPAPPHWTSLAAAANRIGRIAIAVSLVVFGARAFMIPTRVTPRHRICLEACPQTRNLSCLRRLHPVFDPAQSNQRARELALEKIDRMAELEIGVFSTQLRR